MKELLLTLIKKIEQIGVTPDLNFSERLRVELSNIILVCTLPFWLMTIISEFFSSEINLSELWINVCWLLVILPPLFINRLEYHKLSQSWVIITGTLFVTVLNLLYGPNLRMEPLYLVYILCAMYFFDTPIAVITITAIITIYICLNNVTWFSIGNPLEDRINSSSNISAFIYGALMIIISVFKIIAENKNYNLLTKSQKNKLKLQNEELERFAYVAAHDLKTPLRNLNSYLGLIDMKYDKSNEQINQYIKSSKQSATQLHSLIDDILTYSNLDNQNKIDWVDLNSVIDDVKQNFSFEIDAKAAQIEASNLPEIKADKLQLLLLFQNLIENGLKYNEDNLPHVTIKAKIDQSNCQIHVMDNGIGIDEQYQEQIFAMFQRLHPSATYKGTGLGLAISKKIVENLGGSIIVQSTEGTGSTFIIKLPIDIIKAF